MNDQKKSAVEIAREIVGRYAWTSNVLLNGVLVSQRVAVEADIIASIEAERAEVDQLREALKGATIIANKTGSILGEKEAREAALLKALEEIREQHATTPLSEGLESEALLGRLLKCREIADAAILTTTGGAGA